MISSESPANSLRPPGYDLGNALVIYFGRRFHPGGKRCPCLVPQHLDCGDASFLGRFADFFVEKGIVEAGLRCVFLTTAVVDRVKPRPVDRGQTHGTWLTAGVDFASSQRKAAERS